MVADVMSQGSSREHLARPTLRHCEGQTGRVLPLPLGNDSCAYRRFRTLANPVLQQVRTPRGPYLLQEAGLAEEVADLGVVPGGDGLVRAARIAEVDAQVLHGRLHDRRQAVARPAAGEH